MVTKIFLSLIILTVAAAFAVGFWDIGHNIVAHKSWFFNLMYLAGAEGVLWLIFLIWNDWDIDL